MALLNFDFVFQFGHNKLDIIYNGIPYGHGFLWNNLFRIDLFDSISFTSLVADSNKNVDSVTWHARLEHIGRDRMTRLA